MGAALQPARSRKGPRRFAFALDSARPGGFKRPMIEAPTPADPPRRPGDEDARGAPQTAENLCPRCGGSGRLEAGPCPMCGGAGRVVEIVGDA
jgi:hypothetical protein